MSLNSDQIDAFFAVARQLSFSRAAATLHVTQSALSQRVKNLETTLGVSLFVRGAGQLRLTEAGQRLLRYVQTKDSLESEFLSDLSSKPGQGLSGQVRVAGYSSVVRSVLLQRLAPFLRRNPRVQCELFSRELAELPGFLSRSEADFVVLDHKLERAGIEAVEIGFEEMVLIEATKHEAVPDVYLDHDAEDRTTENFFRGQPARLRPDRLRRSFLDDVYGILDGVALGLGRAVLSRHLVEKSARVRVVPGYRPLRSPVVLHFAAQPYYSKLHQETLKALSG